MKCQKSFFFFFIKLFVALNLSLSQIWTPITQKLLQVFRSQLSFLQFIFQHEPNALKSQEDEWLRLEARAKDLQQQVLEEELTSQKRLKVCIFYFFC